MLRGLIFGSLCLCNAVVHAAEIYLCKTSQGATYWASSWCNRTGGYTIDAVIVPDGMEFREQARIGDQIVARKRAVNTQQDTARDRLRTCHAMDEELAQIWSRYSNWQFNENAQIGRDQTRTRELKAQRQQLGCETR
jgi:hypothetical protein